MNVYAEAQREKTLLDQIVLVADMEESLGFADLFRGGDDFDHYLQRIQSGDNPGVKFTTRKRVVVIEFHFGQLRYYAGGWVPEDELTKEDARKMSEGCELGEFDTIQHAMRFAKEYLVNNLPLQTIDAPRRRWYLREASEPQLTKVERPALFGVISVCGVPLSALGLLAGIGNRGGDFGALGALGVAWIILFGSFVCAVVGLVRSERPLWPAVVGGLLTLLPGLLFIIGALTWLSHWFGRWHAG